MAGHRKFNDLRGSLAGRVGEEHLAAAERDELERYEHARERLRDVRRARALTQVQLARALGVSQAQVSRIESQGDLFLSTLASYITAMGGRLELRAVFDGVDPIPLDVGLNDDAPPGPAPGDEGEIVERASVSGRVTRPAASR